MSLEKWSPIAPVPSVEPGFVVYDTEFRRSPHVYHTMLVRQPKQLEPGAPTVVFVADMTIDCGIRFGEKPSVPFRMRDQSYVGSLTDVPTVEHSRVLAHLDTLMLLPSAAGGWI